VKRLRWLIVAVCALLLAAGAFTLLATSTRWEPLVDADQTSRQEDLGAALEPGNSVGQTFVARHAGLSGVEFFLTTENKVPVSVTLHLRSDPGSQVDLATASLQLPAEAGSRFYRFAFPSFEASHGQSYYAFLKPSQDGVSVALSDGAAYLDGAAYQADEPLDAQTAFRLVYAPSSVVLDLLGTALSCAGLLAVSGLLFIVPGWALLAWLLPGRNLTWAEMLGLASGVSLALYPLLLIWTHLIGLKLGSLYIWLPVALGLVALLWRYRSWRPAQSWNSWQRWFRSRALWPDITLLIALVLVFGLRLLVIRTLAAPLWADSVQHTVMTQLILDHDGLFNSWEPYAPYHSLTVHFGFPMAAALLSWVTGRTSVEATLLAGQLINAMAILTLYPLAVRIANGSKWAGVGAVAIGGLLSPMPAHYVNWGRFAQLAGQAVLPVALWLMCEALQKKGSSWKVAGLAGGTAAGMTLAYYRMPFYYAVFVICWLIGWTLPRWKLDGKAWLRGFAQLALIGGIAFLLILPLGLRLVGGTLASGLTAGVSVGSTLDAVLADYQIWQFIEAYVPRTLIVATLFALALSLWQRRWSVTSIGLWILGLAALSAGQLIHLPGANYMNSFAILITLYIPVSLLVGWLIGQVAELLRRWNLQWGLSFTILLLAGWGGIEQVGIVEPSRILVTHPDVQAMSWIRESTVPTSRFLVEAQVYQGYSAIGTDAGWWIPLLANRQTTMPPQYALLSEVPVEPGYSQRVVDLVKHLSTDSVTSPQTIALLCDWGVTHLYIGQQQAVSGEEPKQLFSPRDLAGSAAFREAYHQDRVWIYALNNEMCGGSR
jgi:hypothetical protein